jgi:hypothetical protein
VREGGYSICLQKVSDNEVRLWSFSGESLEMFLSPDR